VRRVVLDCNVFVSALLSPDGTPAEILERWADGDFDLIVSPRLLAEVETVLGRPKFRASIDGIHVAALLSGLIDDGVLIEDPPAQPGLTPDPGDDYLVALARKADAQCIVSGDAHLRELTDAGPLVLTPREFLHDETSHPK
jgi:putative PIN family toxin of toxin-antitoxin system